MKSMFLKSSMALLVTGMTTFTAPEAFAVTALTGLGEVTPPSCDAVGNATDFATIATKCIGTFNGNDVQGDGSGALKNLLDANAFDVIDTKNPWEFQYKNDGTEIGDLANYIEVQSLGQTSGILKIAEASGINPAITNLVISLKGANFWSAYLFEKNTYGDYVNGFIELSWDMQGVGQGRVGSGGSNPALSHISVFTQVPTPALLPGLIGMGVAALRKKKGESEESDS